MKLTFSQQIFEEYSNI